MAVYTLNKKERLKSRKQISHLFETGRAFHQPPVRAVYVVGDSAVRLLAGFSVSKKNFKRATIRNRIKRQMREAWRLHAAGLKQNVVAEEKELSVFLIFTGKEIPDYVEVENAVIKVIERLTVVIADSK